MKTKMPLILTELLIMLLVFSLAASFCMKAFTWSELTSRHTGARGNAALQAQNAAEVVKACQGNFGDCAAILEAELVGEGCMEIYFDRNWTAADSNQGQFCMTCQKSETANPLLGTAEITVTDRSGGELFSMEVCWQEEYHEEP